MKYVIEQVRKKENRQMLSVVRMEIDYELVTLFDAMQANNKLEIIKAKEKLTYLVRKLNALSSMK
ncbi:hypothetical protein ACFSKI_17420 [Pseudogracilibacillus auburnensis]|uniref:Uncharacterized protein n=1 Tax=Pseudogracilibacillus auburnensis TaxID=1494959 RepID=A0A2V3W7V5_9BACI|nr:hypothetical protein [Pseudogracilibacillus auburnensis]MBO1003559.1 hypothetical protein [Pseudogracilibacillus auburnensis]PXW89248.1 hypothetical protein DFR56_10224 [Pseudogracilibacillus auburnensis]